MISSQPVLKSVTTSSMKFVTLSTDSCQTPETKSPAVLAADLIPSQIPRIVESADSKKEMVLFTASCHTPTTTSAAGCAAVSSSTHAPASASAIPSRSPVNAEITAPNSSGRLPATSANISPKASTISGADSTTACPIAVNSSGIMRRIGITMSGSIFVTSTVNWMSAFTSSGAFLIIACVKDLKRDGRSFVIVAMMGGTASTRCRVIDGKAPTRVVTIFITDSTSFGACVSMKPATPSTTPGIASITRSRSDGSFSATLCATLSRLSMILGATVKIASIKSGAVSTTVSATCVSNSPAPFADSAINLPTPFTTSGADLMMPSTTCSTRETPPLINSGKFLIAASPTLSATVPITDTASGRISAAFFMELLIKFEIASVSLSLLPGTPSTIPCNAGMM